MQVFVKSLTVAIAFAALLQLSGAAAAQQPEPDIKAPDIKAADVKPAGGDAASAEISIGNIMPYTGMLAPSGRSAGPSLPIST